MNYPAICTSSSPVVCGAAAGAACPGVSFGIIVFKNGPTFSFSRILKFGFACTSFSLGTPMMPIEVLFTLSSLSCCNVSRRACKP